jgi:hypothetical protein
MSDKHQYISPTPKCSVCSTEETENNRFWNCRPCDTVFCESHLTSTGGAVSGNTLTTKSKACPNGHRDASSSPWKSIDMGVCSYSSRSVATDFDKSKPPTCSAVGGKTVNEDLFTKCVNGGEGCPHRVAADEKKREAAEKKRKEEKQWWQFWK